MVGLNERAVFSCDLDASLDGNMHIVETTMELNIENVLVDPRDMIGKGSDVHSVTADDV